jgi:hypothetical protein
MSRSPVDLGLLLALVASATINLWLATTVRTNKERSSGALQIPLLSPGDTIRSLSVYTLEEARTVVRFDDVAIPTVLYVFTPTCRWCAENQTAIRALASSAGAKYRFIGISISDSLEGVKTYLSESSLPFPVFARVSLEDGMRYGFGVTPQTFVVTPDGAILQRWTGAYTGSVLNELELYFNTKLPDVQVPRAKSSGHFDRPQMMSGPSEVTGTQCLYVRRRSAWI